MAAKRKPSILATAIFGHVRVWARLLVAAIAIGAPPAVVHATTLDTPLAVENSPPGFGRNFAPAHAQAELLQALELPLESAFGYGQIVVDSAYATRGAASSAVNALRLGKQLASEAGVAELTAGGGKVIAGAGTRTAIQDLPRLIGEYGGTAKDWTKVSSQATRFVDGTVVEVHGYRNITTGELIELKSKVGSWSP